MEIKKIFREFIDNTGFSGTVRFDEEIAPLTTFKIGGIASVFVAPEETFQIQDIFSLVKKYQIPYLILGGGSNIVFRDGVFEGVVISTAKMKGCFHSDFKDSEKKPDAAESVLVACAAGTSMEELVSYCTDNNLWGLENFSGLPGSVGGAMYMNARCFEKSISELLVGGVFLDIDTMEERDFSSSLAHEELWGYKKSPFQKGNAFVLQGIFKLEKRTEGERGNLVGLNEKYIRARAERRHFDFPSAGSVFKNNHLFGSPSGKIIDECGLRGTKIGNAQVAPFHGNFIINLGGATQKDVKNLVEYVVNTVEERKGFKLEPEIVFF